MNERLLEFLKVKNLTPSQFAEIMDIQPSSVSHITSGRNKPSFDFFAKLLEKFPDVNPDWLILGYGNIYRAEKSEEFSFLKKDMEMYTAGHHTKQNKNIEKIIIFYSDKTFEVYNSE
ncbi:MAG: helix-turn-helix domain-containing protein [Rikenellaceae bacterium]|nr:helix-turn-helix domain-containing protein [Rikenellaceae bacterium]